MNYFLLTVLGATMFSNQQHQIVGDMIDMDTGEVILILPEKSEINKKFIDSLDVWGKDNVSTISFDDFKNLNSSLNPTNQLRKHSADKSGNSEIKWMSFFFSPLICLIF